MKTETLYRKPDGRISSMGTTEEAVVTVFLESYVNGDMNVKTFSLKKQKSKKNYPATHVYFVPNEGVKASQWEPSFKRARQFFTAKEGCLFGAKVELARFGKLASFSQP